jgi:hypothetical protein
MGVAMSRLNLNSTVGSLCVIGGLSGIFFGCKSANHANAGGSELESGKAKSNPGYLCHKTSEGDFGIFEDNIDVSIGNKVMKIVKGAEIEPGQKSLFAHLDDTYKPRTGSNKIRYSPFNNLNADCELSATLASDFPKSDKKIAFRCADHEGKQDATYTCAVVQTQGVITSETQDDAVPPAQVARRFACTSGSKDASSLGLEKFDLGVDEKAMTIYYAPDVGLSESDTGVVDEKANRKHAEKDTFLYNKFNYSGDCAFSVRVDKSAVKAKTKQFALSAACRGEGFYTAVAHCEQIAKK